MYPVGSVKVRGSAEGRERNGPVRSRVRVGDTAADRAPVANGSMRYAASDMREHLGSGQRCILDARVGDRGPNAPSRPQILDPPQRIEARDVDQ